MLELCDLCHGEGWEPGEYEDISCPLCEGEGFVKDVPCPCEKNPSCHRCYGEGSISEIECPKCEHKGTITVRVKCSSCRGLKTVLPKSLFEKS